MNTTDAEIAGKIDGVTRGGVQVKKDSHNDTLWVTDGENYIHVESGSDYLDHCRAVVDEVDGKNKKLQKIFNALDNHLGDTDPDILEDATDEEICDEEPVFWAANEIAKILKENK